MLCLVGIQRIPFTYYNICPRMRRAFRKNSAVAIFVAIIIALITLILSSYINFLIAIRGEKEKNRSDSLIIHSKNFSPMNNISHKNQSVINNISHFHWSIMSNDLNQIDEYHTLLFTVLLFIFVLLIIISVIIFVCIYTSKFVLCATNRKENNDERRISVPVNVYTSVMTQTSEDL